MLLEMKVIARIHSDFPQKFGIPRQSGIVPELSARIVFEPEFRDAHALRGIDETGTAARFITGAHHATAQSWAEACGFEYLPVHDDRELEEALARFTQPSVTQQPLLMEVFTDSDADVRHLREYYRSLKKG